MKEYNGTTPVNIGNTREYSIEQVVNAICEILEYKGSIIWSPERPSGQYRKPSSNKNLLSLGWKKENYTSLKIGLKKTCEWVKINYPNIRGVK